MRKEGEGQGVEVMRRGAPGGRRRSRLAAGEARRRRRPQRNRRAPPAARACQQPWHSARTSEASAGTSPVSAFRGAAAMPPSIADAHLRCCCAAAGLPNRAAGAWSASRAGSPQGSTAAATAAGHRPPHRESARAAPTAAVTPRARLRALADGTLTRGRVGVSAEAKRTPLAFREAPSDAGAEASRAPEQRGQERSARTWQARTRHARWGALFAGHLASSLHTLAACVRPGATVPRQSPLL
jgi:hypothetical protein